MKGKIMILFKVVEKRTRNCSNLTIYRESLKKMLMGSYNIEKIIKPLKKNYPLLFPIYKKGSIVKAHPDSSGIFCFESKKGARIFISEYSLWKNAMIIKVAPIGHIEKSKFKFIWNCGGDPKSLAAFPLKHLSVYPNCIPYNKVCSVMSVKVLE